MSDIREAFEAWFEGVFDPKNELLLEDKDMCAQAWQAALQSQTAPAVPEGWELRKVEAEETTISVHRKSDGKWCAGGQLGAYGRHGLLFEFFDAILTATPQPDHSPDAGKVVAANPCRAHGRFPCPTCNVLHFAGCDCHFCSQPPAADGGEVEPADDSSTVYRIGDLGNQIHNLGCSQQNNEELADSLAELAHQVWVLQRDVMRDLTATHPAQPRNEDIAVDLEAWLSQVRHMEGLSAHDIIESAEDYITLLRSNGGDA